MTEQVDAVAWTADHLDDLDADLLRFYGREWQTMSGPEFFSRALRVSAYGGVMTVRIAELEHEPAPEPGDDLDDLDAIARDPDLAGLVEVG